MAWISAALLVVTLAVVRAEYTLKCDADGCTAKGKSSKPVLIQGDILVDDVSSRNAIADRRMLWPNRMVPFVFHETHTMEEKSRILSAMKAISDRTCVTFRERTSAGQGNYLMITKEPNGCYANVGYVPNAGGFSRLNLQNPGCFGFGTMQHELLHVLGLFHEQSRPDRDSYVNIHWSNIQAGKESNFDKMSTREATTYGLPYDYLSVMHYAKFDFAQNPSMPTITSKSNPSMSLGQRDGPTNNDLEKIRRLYC